MHWAGLMPGAGGLLSPALVAAHLTSYHVNVDPTRGTTGRQRDTGRVHRRGELDTRGRLRRTFALYVAVCVLFYLTLTLTLDTSQSAREATRA